MAAIAPSSPIRKKFYESKVYQRFDSVINSEETLSLLTAEVKKNSGNFGGWLEGKIFATKEAVKKLKTAPAAMNLKDLQKLLHDIKKIEIAIHSPPVRVELSVSSEMKHHRDALDEIKSSLGSLFVTEMASPVNDKNPDELKRLKNAGFYTLHSMSRKEYAALVGAANAEAEKNLINTEAILFKHLNVQLKALMDKTKEHLNLGLPINFYKVISTIAEVERSAEGLKNPDSLEIIKSACGHFLKILNFLYLEQSDRDIDEPKRARLLHELNNFEHII